MKQILLSISSQPQSEAPRSEQTTPEAESRPTEQATSRTETLLPETQIQMGS